MSYFDTVDFREDILHFDEILTKISNSLGEIAARLSEMNKASDKDSQNINQNRILQAFQTYVGQDCSAAGPTYVKEILRDMCGLSLQEMEKYGFGWLLTDEEYADAKNSRLSDHLIS